MENVAILKVVGDTEPAKNIFEMVQSNPRYLGKYLKEILIAVRAIKYFDFSFWYETFSMTGILYFDDQWVFLDRWTINYKGEDCTGSNFIALFETFNSLGLSMKQIKEEFSRTLYRFEGDYHFYRRGQNYVTTECLKKNFKLNEIKQELRWYDFE